jgi:DNA polymerase III sliding clamp (beta) subunit (PCNA family)
MENIMENLTLFGEQFAKLAGVTVAAMTGKNKQTMPNLGVAHLTLSGFGLTVAATDRYILAAGQTNGKPYHADTLEQSCSVTVDAAEFAAAAKLYAKAHEVALTFDENELIISSGAGQTILKYTDFQFPDYVRILNTAGAPVENLLIDATIFGKLAKISGEIWAAQFCGDNKPVIFTADTGLKQDLAAVAFKVAVMPRRQGS